MDDSQTENVPGSDRKAKKKSKMKDLLVELLFDQLKKPASSTAFSLHLEDSDKENNGNDYMMDYEQTNIDGFAPTFFRDASPPRPRTPSVEELALPANALEISDDGSPHSNTESFDKTSGVDMRKSSYSHQEIAERMKNRYLGADALCFVCGTWVKDSRELKSHRNRHKKGLFTQHCPNLCGRTRPTRKEILTHLSTCTGNPKNSSYPCWGCYSRFPSKTARDDHSALCDLLAGFSCPICHAIYDVKSSLQRHIKNSHENNNKNKTQETQQVQNLEESPLNRTETSKGEPVRSYSDSPNSSLARPSASNHSTSNESNATPRSKHKTFTYCHSCKKSFENRVDGQLHRCSSRFVDGVFIEVPRQRRQTEFYATENGPQHLRPYSYSENESNPWSEKPTLESDEKKSPRPDDRDSEEKVKSEKRTLTCRKCGNQMLPHLYELHVCHWKQPIAEEFDDTKVCPICNERFKELNLRHRCSKPPAQQPLAHFTESIESRSVRSESKDRIGSDKDSDLKEKDNDLKEKDEDGSESFQRFRRRPPAFIRNNQVEPDPSPEPSSSFQSPRKSSELSNKSLDPRIKIKSDPLETKGDPPTPTKLKPGEPFLQYCPYCEDIYHFMDLPRHVYRYHSKSTYFDCPMCDEVFEKLNRLVPHMDRHRY